MRKIFSKSGLRIERSGTITHLISPVNRILLILYRRLLGYKLINNIAKLFIILAERLREKRTRYFTGWFLAYLLSKE